MLITFDVFASRSLALGRKVADLRPSLLVGINPMGIMAATMIRTTIIDGRSLMGDALTTPKDVLGNRRYDLRLPQEAKWLAGHYNVLVVDSEYKSGNSIDWFVEQLKGRLSGEPTIYTAAVFVVSTEGISLPNFYGELLPQHESVVTPFNLR